MAATLERSELPRANVRNPSNPFPADQYVKVPNVAIFSEHETKTPEGNPQRFDQEALQRLIDRGNERIAASGDYAAVCVGHTHDPDDANGAEEQPEVIGAMGPYRLGLLGNPGRQQKYAILADLWIRRDKIDKYNAHPRRSVELWYEHDRPAWIDPLSLLTEAPRLDLGLTPLIPADAGSDGADLRYLYSATAGGLRRVKYAAACAASGNVFVPAATGERSHYAAGPTNQTKEDALMLAPEDIKQICDAIEQLDVIAAMRDFLPMVPRVQALLEKEAAEHAAMDEVPTEPVDDNTPDADGGITPPAGESPVGIPESAAPNPDGGSLPDDLDKVDHAMGAGHHPSDGPTTPGAIRKPTGAPSPSYKPSGGLSSGGGGTSHRSATPPGAGNAINVRHSADAGDDAGDDPKPEKKDGTPTTKLDDMSEDEIERYLCARRAKYAAGEGTADGKGTTAPAQGTVDPGNATPAEGSVAGQSQATAAKYSMLEAKLAELEADRVARTNESRKAKLTQLRYHRAFDLDKEVTRTTYAKMTDEQFRSHVDLIAEVATPTLANQPMPVPDELLSSSQPAPAVRQGPEKYTREKADEAVRICYERQKAGKSVTYEVVLDALVNGKPIPE